MLSKLRPLFKDIQTYYEKIRVSLYAEKERLEKINRSRRVTPDDRCRWEYIRDACKEAYDLLTSENNNASRDIKALAQAVEKARGSLSEACRDIKEHTRGLQPGILRLQSEYKNGVETCQGRINELLEFSESFLNSIPQVLQRDDFRDHLLPSAPASSDQILQEVGRQVKSSSGSLFASLMVHLLTFVFFPGRA
ncbi:hypothetical protein BC827DRAFT_1248663 [Russula dissimulans]|nr:hypothetical protein BC827DRAFT_1248663 [Russula dissimulans]